VVRRNAGAGGCVIGLRNAGRAIAASLDLAVPVTNLVGTRAGDQVSLAWTMPKKNTDKLLLKGDLPVHVCRREDAASSCTSVGDLQLAPEAEGLSPRSSRLRSRRARRVNWPTLLR